VNPYIRDALVQDEGLRLKTYRCTAGKLTIGVGRNLDDNGITREEAFYLLNNDIAAVHADLTRKFPWYGSLDEVREARLAPIVDFKGRRSPEGLPGGNSDVSAVPEA
jgi:lysozyme